MSSCISCIILLLTHELAAGVFTSTPKDISPKKTKSVVLRCDPEVDKSMSILVIQIMKSTDTTAPPPAETGDQSGGTTGDQSGGTKEHQDVTTTTTTTTTTKLPLPFLGGRRKRSSDDVLVTVTITMGNNIDIVPANDRFNATGQMERPAYLSLTIDSPGVNDMGMYKCEVSLLVPKQGVRTTSELVEIREEIEMSMDDLHLRVKMLEDERHSNTLAIQAVRKQVKECVQVSGFALEDIIDLQKKTNILQKTITEIAEQVRSLSSKVSDGKDSSRATGSRGDDKQVDELFKLSARIDQLTTTQLQALSRNLKQVRDYEVNTQERVFQLESMIDGPIKKRLSSLEAFDWTGFSKSLQDIEIKTIPMIIMNITETRKNVTELQNRLDKCCANANEKPDENNLQTPRPEIVTTTTTTEEPVLNYTGPACYVCGNNITDSQCPITDKKRTEACPASRPHCITDIYENGHSRHVYKRCASEKECKVDSAKSSPQCSTTDFRTIGVMECHFCCLTQLCNSYLRPEDYQG